MKTLKFNFLTVVIASLLITLSADVYAQRPNQGAKNTNRKPQKEYAIPDLTDAQKEQIKELQTANMKVVTPLKNQLQEKKAHLNTLRSSEKPNMNEIDKTIDEITGLTGKMMKQRERFIQDVRKILTDEQRVHFDANGAKLYNRNKGMHGKTNQGRKPMK